ncbi:MAG TPA: hypothetical protein VIM14_07570 [Polyangia bacterium]
MFFSVDLPNDEGARVFPSAVDSPFKSHFTFAASPKTASTAINVLRFWLDMVIENGRRAAF